MIEKLRKIAEDVCLDEGKNLYDIEFKNTQKGKTLMIFVTQQEKSSTPGVTIEDCRNISRKISDILDTEDFMPENYYLEVSSPGLERKLTSEKHYFGAIGENLKVTYVNNGKSTTVKGKLTKINEGKITLTSKNMDIIVNLENIKRARTVFEMKKKER